MNSVLSATGYVLVHVPDLVRAAGSTQTSEALTCPDSDYLAALPQHLRSYQEALEYYPNQVYLGALTPEELAAAGESWVGLRVPDARRFGPFGELMPQGEFYLLLQACDSFDVVKLTEGFVAQARPALDAHPLLPSALLGRVTAGVPQSQVDALVLEEHAVPLYQDGSLVGCVKKAHDFDPNLSAHVMLENLASKTSGVLAVLHGLKDGGLAAEDIDYVIDCSEEACGDMNQRGGGNFAKAIAEAAGLSNATGSDARAFCAGPTHAIIQGAALVKAGAYRTVLVVGGGCTAKLGMNGKDHVKKGLPILEDVLGSFCAIISQHNETDPEIDLSVLGRHTVGTGSAPQAVIGSLVSQPLARAGLRILDVDKFAPELQNPDITKPAGAGDVPLSNYKMIGALAAKNGEITPKELPDFVKTHGMVGWAPTQGHIPSAVPYLGFARRAMRANALNTALFVGKGSLFLGRMTSQFDGVSFLLRKNSGETESPHCDARPAIAVTAPGSECGEEAVLQGAVAAARSGIRVTFIGSLTHPDLVCVPAVTPEDAQLAMERLLAEGKVAAGVTMHYPFPIGVATVGRAVTPARGRELFLATTTGTAAPERVEAMVRGALCGIIAAKSCGISAPTVGILNVDGAREVESRLKALAQQGYPISFAQSCRGDGGSLLRGNDVLAPNCDVLVTDSLTGNLLSKMLSAATSGGSYETVGFGYGPGIGPDYRRLVLILSRASGAPVVTNALRYAADLLQGDFFGVAQREYDLAQRAGLEGLFPQKAAPAAAAPPSEVVTAQLAGIDILSLDAAAETLWAQGIFAQTGMGCTGPVLLVAERNRAVSLDLLQKAGFLPQT
ncbi:MAG: glycine/sarcosine/betaine reductase complex component C subunit beta [Oscillospiraceae bacterium]